MEALEQWDLVVFADRNFTPEGFADAQARRIEEDTGVTVAAQDFALTGLESERIPAMIRDESFPDLGEAIAGAEVIVVNGTPPIIDLDPCLGGSVRSAAAGEAAQQAGVPFVSMYDLLNGPDHGRDMREAGHLAGAMWQASETAGDLMTDALAATGYAPVTPPGD